MGFTHGKTARHFVDAFELTNQFNDFTSAGKSGQAETTVWGLGAKTFIAGIKEGQISAKGFFDSAANRNDAILTAALGRASNIAVSHSPDGSLIQGNRIVVAYAAETDYTLTSPVAGVNAVSYSALADSGLQTGCVLWSSVDSALTTIGTVSTSATTVAAGSNAVNTNTFTGSGTLNVASTTGFPTAGSLIVVTGTTPAVITYTGTGATTFTGCNTTTGGGVLATGANVDYGFQEEPVLSVSSYVSNLHVISITGTGATFTAKVQHSADGHTWADLASFNGGSAITSTGAFSAFAAWGTTVNIYKRAVLNTTGSTSINLKALVTGATQ